MTPAQSTPGRAPANHFISILLNGTTLSYVDANGKQAATIYVRRGDIVQWHFVHGNYSIVFKGPSPFQRVGFAGTGNVPTGEAEVTAPDGTYQYAVTVVPPAGQAILDDPEIIVGDGT